MRIACLGGGPGGLLAALLAKRSDPDREVTVFERNQAGDTFGFGVVFSDATLDGIDAADPVLRRALDTHGAHWDPIEVRLHGERWRFGGNGMAAVARRTLLGLLTERAVRPAWTSASPPRPTRTTCCAPGTTWSSRPTAPNSGVRTRLSQEFGPSVVTATAKFIWFGTTYPFGGLTFVHEQSPHGVFAVHGYPIGNGTSTFIVETDENVLARAGLDAFDVSQPPGPSDELTRAYLEKLFAEQIDGAPLLVNNSRWGNFRTWRTQRWRHRPVPQTAPPWPCSATPRTPRTSPWARAPRWPWRTPSPWSPRSTPGRGPARPPRRWTRPWPITRPPGGPSHQDPGRGPAVAVLVGAFRPAPTGTCRHGSSLSVSSAARCRRQAAPARPGLRRRGPAAWCRLTAGRPLDAPLDIAGHPAAPPRRPRPDRAAHLASGPLLAGPPVGRHLHHLQPSYHRETAGACGSAPRTLRPASTLAAGAVARGLAAGACLVAVGGGTPLTRRLACEAARLEHGAVTLLVEDGGDDPARAQDAALTAVLSGRTDLVGRPLTGSTGIDNTGVGSTGVGSTEVGRLPRLAVLGLIARGRRAMVAHATR